MRVRLGLLACLFLLRVGVGQQVAFTWDDVPSHSALPAGETRVGIAKGILAAMKAHGLPPAYGFVNGVRLGEEPASEAVLPLWRAAGYPLGNHTWTHMNLGTNTAADWLADMRRNEPLLEKYMPVENYRWLRYPFLAEGDTPEKYAEVRGELARGGYRVASVTMSFGDYLWNEPYARCVAKGDTAAIAELEKSYLEAADQTLTRTRLMGKALGPHEVPYVLLMHVGAFDARMLPRLLTLYEQRGMKFVTLEEAESDPLYREDVDLSLPSRGPVTLERALRARGLPIPPPGPRSPGPGAVCR